VQRKNRREQARETASCLSGNSNRAVSKELALRAKDAISWARSRELSPLLAHRIALHPRGRDGRLNPGPAQAQYENISEVAGEVGPKGDGVLRASVARSLRSTRAFRVRATFCCCGKGTCEAFMEDVLAQAGPGQVRALCGSSARVRGNGSRLGRRSRGSAGSRARLARASPCGGTFGQGPQGFGARSAWACSRGSNACARSSGALSVELHVAGRPVRRGLRGSRAHSARACSLRSNARARSGGARSGNQASAAALAAKTLAAPEIGFAGAAAAHAAVVRVRGVKLRRRDGSVVAAALTV